MTRELLLVPASMINETLYCERLVHLRWAQGETADNHYILEGRAVHEHADTAHPLSAPEDLAAQKPYQARAVWLSSDALKITAKVDVLDVEDGQVDVVEYKRGSTPDIPEGAYLSDRAQVCAQVLLLREHGYCVRSAQIYFAASKKRVSVDIDENLISTTLAAIERALQICALTEPPPPLVDSPKCNGCALSSICLPDEVNHLNGTGEMRQLRPRRDDSVELHVQEQGAKIGLSGECLTVRGREGSKTVQLAHTSGVSIYGNVQVSTQALRELLYRDIPLCFFTTGSWYCGRTAGTFSNVDVRIAQFRSFADTSACLQLVRGIVESKIKNCRTLLMRNASGDVSDALRQLEEAQVNTRKAQTMEQLLGVEGAAARVYFSKFSQMLKTQLGFDFDGRNRRPPLDPVNAMLSFAYSLLVKDVSLGVEKANLDPALGFYHRPRFGRPALALDLMEEFRPLIADSVVVTVVNTGAVSPDDFVRSAGAVALTPLARKAFIQAYERRMCQEIKHPVFGYEVSYRRVLEVQARLLGRVLMGEISEYPAFNTR